MALNQLELRPLLNIGIRRKAVLALIATRNFDPGISGTHGSF